MKIAIYGKGGIGKSTISANLSVSLSARGQKVLQVGADPKCDSAYLLTGFTIPSIIDTLQEKDYHYENIWVEDVVYMGYNGIACTEAGGPPAGAGCGGYVIGETVKLLKELNAFYEYDIILFDVLGDVVCGGFAAPLNYADYCLIITDNGFEALYAANRINSSVQEKARTQPIRLGGLIGNRTTEYDLIHTYTETVPLPILHLIPNCENIRVSRIKSKTLFELADLDTSEAKEFKILCKHYLKLADELLSLPEGVVPNELSDRNMFQQFSQSHLTADLVTEPQEEFAWA